MSNRRFAIGIDLGTTNSSLAYLPLIGDGASEILAIPQWQTLTTGTDAATLPSFLYLPDAATAARLDSGESSWIVGLLARNQAGQVPGKVALSAKSWLGHHSADREARFLPWGSEDLTQEEKLSPLEASGLILDHLKGAWDRKFAGAGKDYAFNAQRITITVPASFDAAAQKLTLRAAEMANYPPGVTLLEEPQAAFYCWLEQQGESGEWWRSLAESGAKTPHVLVVDVGGGTSDFSLFALREKDKSPLPAIERVAVSEHILLGGDNIDLSLAHLVESRLGAELSAAQWEFLVVRCRDLKERVLSSSDTQGESFPIAIPGQGSRLIGATLATQVTGQDVLDLLEKGFFPACSAGERPHEAPGALKEWGLPYAHDGAITRHLAGFLREAPRIDAILFNGGTLMPDFLRQRILEEVQKWQDGSRPQELANPQPMLAVARGAARFGYLAQRREERISAGAARSIFLEVATSGDSNGPPSLVCILPQGVDPDHMQHIDQPPLRLKINQRVRFQAYHSTQRRWSLGELAEYDSEHFHQLPPLESDIRLEPKPGNADGEQAGTPGDTLPVTLEAEINELGMLTVAIVSADHAVSARWPLEFNLRPAESSAAKRSTTTAQAPPLTVDAQQLQKAQTFIQRFYSQPLGKKSKPSPKRCLAGLEEILGQPKGEWNLTLVRTLWRYLETASQQRSLSVEHEESWIINAGFLLRPGFGAPLDDARIDTLWRLHTHGPFFPGKGIKVQLQVLWRRIAAGLDAERQEILITRELNTLRQGKKPPPELIRLAGALERLPVLLKTELVEIFISGATTRLTDGQDASAHLAALGGLLSRTPRYAGPETVLPPQWVERAFEAFSDLDWAQPDMLEMRNLFLTSARLVQDRRVDLDSASRKKIVHKLEKAGAPTGKCQRLLHYTPLGDTDRTSLYGEDLPPGLILH